MAAYLHCLGSGRDPRSLSLSVSLYVCMEQNIVRFKQDRVGHSQVSQPNKHINAVTYRYIHTYISICDIACYPKLYIHLTNKSKYICTYLYSHIRIIHTYIREYFLLFNLQTNFGKISNLFKIIMSRCSEKIFRNVLLFGNLNLFSPLCRRAHTKQLFYFHL